MPQKKTLSRSKPNGRKKSASTPRAEGGATAKRAAILLTNDDGHFSTGLSALRRALSRSFDVTVVAPETEQSAMSHSLTLHRPLRIRHVEKGVVSVDGTPADCVYTALCSRKKLIPSSPVLVVSGINHGPNLGQDVFYSGTVAAAREGALRGRTAIAVSAEVGSDFTRIARFMAVFVKRLLREDAFRGHLLSFNFPLEWRGEVVRAVLGTRLYQDLVDLRTDPRGRPYAWIGGGPRPGKGRKGTDGYYFERGIATVTPLLLDLTMHQDMPRPGLTTALDGALQSMRTSF